MPEVRALATSAEVAEFLQIPLRTLDQYAYLGVGPRYSRVGRYRRYRWADIEKWLDAKSHAGTDARVAS